MGKVFARKGRPQTPKEDPKPVFSEPRLLHGVVWDQAKLGYRTYFLMIPETDLAKYTVESGEHDTVSTMHHTERHFLRKLVNP